MNTPISEQDIIDIRAAVELPGLPVSGIRMIGFTGPARHGKDTTINFMTRHFNCVMVAFSDALYAEVSAAFHIGESFFRNDATKDTISDRMALSKCENKEFVELMIGLGFKIDEPLSPRTILQKWGTEYRRAQDPDYWVKRTHENMKQRPEQVYLISGVRFDNEVALIRQTGFMVHINDPRKTVIPGSHVSEKPVPFLPGDCLIVNDDSLNMLEEKAIELGVVSGLINRAAKPVRSFA